MRKTLEMLGKDSVIIAILIQDITLSVSNSRKKPFILMENVHHDIEGKL